VYAAYDPDLGREVAIKILGQRSDLGKVRLWREALALSGIVHPNVLSVYEVGWLGGTTYIVTELAPHGTLADWLTRPRPLAAVLERFSQVGHGLAAVHRHGLVHRDVKPANVFMAKDGRVLVGDFGLVARVGARGEAGSSVVEAPPTELTADGAAIGTPGYAAPEQWEGRSVDARADQYAFTMSLVRALWGSGVSLADLAAIRALPPTRAGEHVPHDLGAILRRGLGPSPDERYPEMLDLVCALERVCDRLLVRRARRIGAMVLTLSMLGALAWLLWTMR
jgi:serine/threonine protein kinase